MLFRGCNLVLREVTDPEKRMDGTSVKYYRELEYL